MLSLPDFPWDSLAATKQRASSFSDPTIDGPAGAGMPAQYPRLAGQFAEYTEAQLKTFRIEERNNDPEKMMRMIAAKMSDVEIKAVAEYAAGLR